MTDLADAFEAAARVRAIQEWAKQADANVRAFVADQIAQEKDRTGVNPKYDVKNLGSAGWTQPNRSTDIVDRDALGKWGLRQGLSTKRAEVDSSALQHDLDRGDVPAALLAELRDCGYIRDGWLFGQALTDTLDDAVEDGDCLVTVDGEIVPGVRLVAKSQPQLRVIPAPQAVKRATALLAGRLAPLALVEAVSGDSPEAA